MDDVAEKYGFRKTTTDERSMLRRHSIPEILKFLGIPIWKVPAIINHVRSLMSEIGPDIRLFDGVAQALEQVNGAGVRLAVISANSTKNVQRILGPELAALFAFYECGIDLSGKPAKIAHLLDVTKIAPERFILIGDELRDIEAARKAGIRVGVVP
jgi:phosphoglycolate phosphatase